MAPKVKVGDEVEAGDVLSDGIPNPAIIASHKGIGEGRRQFVDILHNAFKQGGFNAHRRNIEVMARGLLNHVRITDLDGPADSLPDDIREYDSLVRGYQARHGTQSLPVKDARGLYLEAPVLHYSIGTPVTPRVAAALAGAGVEKVQAHKDPTPFVPDMTRAMETAAFSDDWMVRMAGLYGVKRSVLDAARLGGSSEEHSTSFIPALARGVDFGKDIRTKGVY
jgi:hypothetical protein